MVPGHADRNTSQAPTGPNRVVTITALADDGGTANNGDDTAAPNVASTVGIAPAVDLPVPDNDVSTNEDLAFTFDVRANDANPDGGVLSVYSINGTPITVGNPVHASCIGTVTLNANGTQTFTLDADLQIATVVRPSDPDRTAVSVLRRQLQR